MRPGWTCLRRAGVMIAGFRPDGLSRGPRASWSWGVCYFNAAVDEHPGLPSVYSIYMADVPLLREEWDFSTCPDQYLKFCYCYEMGRSSPAVREAFAKAKSSDFDAHGIWRAEVYFDHMDEDGARIVDLHEVISAPVGFPETPFLLTDFSVLDKIFTPPTLRVRVADDEDLPPEDIYPLYIDWTASNYRLQQSFGDWLQLNRPADRPGTEERGKRTSSVRHGDLKALGAYRLLQHLSLAEALQYTFAARGNEKGLYASTVALDERQKEFRDIVDMWRLALVFS